MYSCPYISYEQTKNGNNMHICFNPLIMWVNPTVVRVHAHMKWNGILKKETPNEIIDKVWFFIHALRLSIMILNLLIDSNSHTLTSNTFNFTR